MWCIISAMPDYASMTSKRGKDSATEPLIKVACKFEDTYHPTDFSIATSGTNDKNVLGTALARDLRSSPVRVLMLQKNVLKNMRIVKATCPANLPCHGQGPGINVLHPSTNFKLHVWQSCSAHLIFSSLPGTCYCSHPSFPHPNKLTDSHLLLQSSLFSSQQLLMLSSCPHEENSLGKTIAFSSLDTASRVAILSKHDASKSPQPMLTVLF